MIMAIVKNLSVIMHPSQKSNKKTVISLLILKTNIRGIRLKRETGKGERHTKIQGNLIGLIVGKVLFSSVQFSHSVMSDFLRPHESQHTRPPCLSPTPGVHSDSCPSSQWCHPAISSSVVPFSSCPQSLPASESFPVSQLFTWRGQSTGVSALASFPPKKSKADLL